MHGGLSHLVWHRRRPWVWGMLALALSGMILVWFQLSPAWAVLASRDVKIWPGLCPDPLTCPGYYGRHLAYLGEWGPWLVNSGYLQPTFLGLAVGSFLAGMVGIIVAYPKTRDMLRAARQLRRRAEQDPWQKRYNRPLPLPSIHGRSWAARSQVEDMLAEQLSPRRHLAGRVLFLGTWGGQLVAVYPGWDGKLELDHLLLIAPTGSGKGMSIKSNLMAWRGSAIVAELKGEFYRDLAGYLSKRGHRCLVFSVTGDGHRYDPFLEFDDGLGLETAANLLIQPERDVGNQIFGQRAVLALNAGLLAARRLGRATLPYLAEISAGGMRSYLETLTALDDPAISRKLNMFLGEPLGERDWNDVAQDRFLQSCWGNLTTRLEPLCAAPILAATNGSDFTAADLRDLKRPTTLFLNFPRETLEATLPLYQLVTESLLRGLTRGGPVRSEHRDRPVLWMCDEAHLLKPPNLPEHLNTLRDLGVVAWVVLQSRAQLSSLFGKDGAEAIEAGCATQIFYRPADLETSKYISTRAGMMPFPQESTSQREAEPKGNTNVGLTARPLIRPEEVSELRDNQIIVFPRGRPPVAAHRLWPTDLGHGKEAFGARSIDGQTRLVPRYPAPALPRLQPPPAPPKEAEEPREHKPSGAVGRIARARRAKGDEGAP